MSSERKIRSARANGAKSRGPKTPQGKARSSRNGITHGLSSSAVVLQNESTERFESLRQTYIIQLAPRNQIEADLVDQLVVARWRLERAWSIETSFLDLEMARQRDAIQRGFERIDQPTVIALAFKPLCDDSRVLPLLNRYEIRFERTYRRTIQALRDLRQLEEKTTVQSEPNPISEHLGPPDPVPPLSAPPSVSPTPAPVASNPSSQGQLLPRAAKTRKEICRKLPFSPLAEWPVKSPRPAFFLRLNGYRGAKCIRMH